MKCVFIAIALFVVSFFCCPIFAQQTSKPQLLDYDSLLKEKFKNFTPQEKQEFCDSRLGVKLLPECWKLVSPVGAIGIIAEIHEPLPNEAIEALDRVFPAVINEPQLEHEQSIKTINAALLYRYGNMKGRAYLFERLKNADVEAAVALVMNREEEALSGALKIILQQKEVESELILALGEWKRPEIRKVLLESFEVALNKKESGYGNYIIPLAQQRATEAIPLIRRFDREARAKSIGSHLNSIAALIMLNAPERVQLVDYFNRLLLANFPLNADEDKLTPFERDALGTQKGELMALMAQTGEKSFIKAIETMLTRWMALYDKQYKFNTPPGDNPEELAVLAAKALGKLHSTTSRPLIEKLMLKLKERKSQWLGDVVSRAMFDIGGTQSEEFLQKVMGKDWLVDEKNIGKLKPLSERFLPLRGRHSGHKYDYYR